MDLGQIEAATQAISFLIRIFIESLEEIEDREKKGKP
jgi:hypothetical protein